MLEEAAVPLAATPRPERVDAFRAARHNPYTSGN
jgi:hypothetical protein